MGFSPYLRLKSESVTEGAGLCDGVASSKLFDSCPPKRTNTGIFIYYRWTFVNYRKLAKNNEI
jgi:hypothetical protein